MTQPFSTSAPILKPEFCFNERILRDFLRVSRAAIDDPITQNLNALITPARDGFDPLSTNVRLPETTSKRKADSDACRSFQNKILYPSWQMRSDILNYCAAVAMSLDSSDPDLVSRQVKPTNDREQIIDERMDPYSTRFSPKETRAESLAILVRNEKSIEKIVRSRTWSVIAERCDTSDNWEEALDRWRRSRA